MSYRTRPGNQCGHCLLDQTQPRPFGWVTVVGIWCDGGRAAFLPTMPCRAGAPGVGITANGHPHSGNSMKVLRDNSMKSVEGTL